MKRTFDAHSKTLDVNTRLYCGLVMLLVVAPLTNVLYLLFDPKDNVVGWFYMSNHFFVMSLGPHLFLLTSLAGVFLLFPKDSKRAYALILPFGYTLAKIIWISQATSNAEYNSIVPSSFIVLAFLITALLHFMGKFLLDRKYHKHDGIVAHILGLMKIKGISEEERARLLEQEFSKLKAFQTKY